MGSFRAAHLVWARRSDAASLARLYLLVDPASPSVQSRAMSGAILCAMNQNHKLATVRQLRHVEWRKLAKSQFKIRKQIQNYVSDID